MRIVVFVADDRQHETAGVRIRYGRLKRWIEAAGHRFELMEINAFRSADALQADVCLFCKCHDVRSLMVAAALREAGVPVGVDVFDDYHSDVFDSGFTHRREWLRRISVDLSFALCATPRMAETLRDAAPGLAVHVMPDPAPEADAEAIASTVERNLERALSTRIVDVLWFGIGDSFHFPVGLTDLAFFGRTFADMRERGFEPRLSVLTNARALDADRIEALMRLPFPVAIEEWSESAEREAIAASLFCFLPVNSGAFSRAKSLNRAVTALTGGAQVLGAGHPLYGALAPFVYDDLGRLIADVERGAPALRRETVGDLLALLESSGGAKTEAERLLAFLATLERRPAAAQLERATPAVIHAQRTVGAIHRLTQRLGSLSVASPLVRREFTFDVRFERRDGAVALLLSREAVSRLRTPLRAALQPADDKALQRLPLSALSTPAPIDLADLVACPSAAIAVTRYRGSADYTARLLEELFGDTRARVSELGSPFMTAADGRRAS